jgi:hypothetical protein
LLFFRGEHPRQIVDPSSQEGNFEGEEGDRKKKKEEKEKEKVVPALFLKGGTF